jgi:hypothetical protein
MRKIYLVTLGNYYTKTIDLLSMQEENVNINISK